MNGMMPRTLGQTPMYIPMMPSFLMDLVRYQGEASAWKSRGRREAQGGGSDLDNAVSGAAEIAHHHPLGGETHGVDDDLMGGVISGELLVTTGMNKARETLISTLQPVPAVRLGGCAQGGLLCRMSR